MIFRNTKMKEVDKDRELTKIAQSISHNQAPLKVGKALAMGAMATSAALVTLRQGHCMKTAEMHTTKYIFKMQKWSESTSMRCQSDKSITDYKLL